MSKKSFKILQLDGGGYMGVIFLVFLVELEKKLGMPIAEYFDMFIGTSTGGICALGFAKGMKAQEILNLYEKNGKKIFNKRLFAFLNPASWWSGKYKRKHVDKLCDKYFKVKMKELKKQFICTSVNMKDTQYTHFFKSYKDKYKDYYASDLVKRTYSAPTYFGYLKDKDGVWSDGGVGVHNCTLLESYIETLRQDKDNYYILSCGTGTSEMEYGNKFIISQIVDFMPIARDQAVKQQVNYATAMDINFDRVDIQVKKKHNKLDGVKYRKEYIKYGKQMAEKYLDKLKISGK